MAFAHCFTALIFCKQFCNLQISVWNSVLFRLFFQSKIKDHFSVADFHLHPRQFFF